MTVDSWLIYVATVLVFKVAPGPSHLLMLSVSLSQGFKRATATAAGDLSANTLQMLLAGLGLATIVTHSQAGLAVVKWLGVAYLIWMGIRQLLATRAVNDEQKKTKPRSAARLWLLGFLTSAANPKAVIFFAALFPQFLDASMPLAPQLLILGLTYLIIDGCFLCAYGAAASVISRRLNRSSQQWAQRFSGFSLIGAALVLASRGVSKA
ncbi:MAG: LysE family translocator [Pseudomonadota bacterium]